MARWRQAIDEEVFDKMIKEPDGTNNLRIKGYLYSGEPPRAPRKKLARKCDLTGKRIGRLLIKEDLGVAKDGWRLWGCVCDCGTKKAVRSRELLRGHTKSCGCLSREIMSRSGGNNRKALGESAFNQLLFNYKKSARERGYDFELTDETFRHLTSKSCYYCGQIADRPAPRAKGTNGDYLYNGIDRIDNNKGYIDGNVRTCCKQCNIAKGVLSESDFLVWAKGVAARFEYGEVPK